MTHPPSSARLACVLGFGPFGEVRDNPSARLARAAHGAEGGGWRIHGEPMPVSYRRSVEHTASVVAAHTPELVLGVGVAMGRSWVALERFGRAVARPLPADVDGQAPPWRSRPSAPPRASRLPVDAMATAAGVRVSDDCGAYVCNAWLYTCLGALPEGLSVGFLHLPPQGWTVSGLLALLAAVRPSEEVAHG